jgi:class 3 adenylate cyclase/YHS domain-containing protein
VADAPPIHTFVFADLAGFTALTEAMGDEDAADLAEDFCAEVRALLPDHDADEIKTIGDAVMLRAAEAREAIVLGLRIVHDVGGRHFFPTVRVGMHTGGAVERGGDWFGATVNIAARVSGEAGGGETLLTDATRQAAGEVSGIQLHDRGKRTLKNVAEPMSLFAAIREGERSAGGLPIDPVCRMAVDPDHAAGRLVHEEVEYHFCSLECAGRFAASPGRYANATR